MRKLLIVDDEKNIRMGLKAMIEREFPGRYALSLAEDGEEALALMEQEEAELVITDIRMPGMDGIALIGRLQERVKRPAVVILSGHDDFAYAKEAIRCEVKEYLLKPIVREELFETLNRLETELARKEEMTEQLARSLQMKEDYLEGQLNYIVMSEEIGEADIRERLHKAGLDWLDGGYYAGALRIAGPPKLDSRKELLGRIDPLLNAGDAEERQVRFFDKDGRLIILASGEGLLLRLGDPSVPGHLPPLRLGVSGKRSGGSGIREACSQAVKALDYFFLQGASGVIRYESVRLKNADYTLPLEEIRRIANMLGSDRETEMMRLFQQVLDIRTIVRYDIGYMEGVSRLLNELVFDKVFQVYGEASIEILKLYREAGSIRNFGHFHEYYHTVESLLQRLHEYVKRLRLVHNDRKEMKKAVDYIMENYHKDLNMAMVSNHVSLNYSYFSQAFKDYTGESFVNYLKKVRIHKAKELLATTERKVYEIGAMAGFENTKQFNRVFREMEGVTPLEYRMQKELWT